MKIIQGNIIITPLLDEQKQLDIALQTAKNPLEITGTIKCFEYCYELSWKTMQKILATMGIIDKNNPRSVFEAAYKNKLIEDLDAWNNVIRIRNLTVHTYDQDLAHEVFNSLPTFKKHLDSFIEIIKRMQ
jgi:nucleotidyltransferase substrate binding protein (TIGR01987 family)